MILPEDFRCPWCGALGFHAEHELRAEETGAVEPEPLDYWEPPDLLRQANEVEETRLRNPDSPLPLFTWDGPAKRLAKRRAGA